MGIYSSNRTGLDYYSGEEIVADESYVGTLGCYNALIDMERNNRAIFEAGIARDFQGAVMVNEGASEEELLAFTEASLGGVISSLKAMLKKIWEKIKGVFNTFLKKLDTVIIRDNKKFVEKYQRQVRTKNLSKLKYKYSKELAGFKELKDALDPGSDLQTQALMILGMLDNESTADAWKKKIDDDNLESYLIGECISDKLKNTEMKDLAKEIHEMCFDSEEAEEGLDSSRLTSIILDLQGDKIKKEITSAQKKTDKHFSTILKRVESYSKELGKAKKGDMVTIPTDTDGGGSKKQIVDDQQVTDSLNVSGIVQTCISTLENIHNRIVACFLNEHKFKISQSRRVFAKAVSYNDKAKNEAAYLDAVEEAAEYEINEMFENYEF